MFGFGTQELLVVGASGIAGLFFLAMFLVGFSYLFRKDRKR